MESSFFVTVGTEVSSEPCTDTTKTVCAFIKFIRSSPSVIYSCNCVGPGGRQELLSDVPLWAAAGLRWGHSLGGRCAGTRLLTALVCVQRVGEEALSPTWWLIWIFLCQKHCLKSKNRKPQQCPSCDWTALALSVSADQWGRPRLPLECPSCLPCLSLSLKVFFDFSFAYSIKWIPYEVIL